MSSNIQARVENPFLSKGMPVMRFIVWKKTMPQALRLGVMLLFLISGVFAWSAETSESAANAKKIFQWQPFLAPFHAVVLHFPIGFLTAAFFLELFRWRRPSEDLRKATLMMLWLSLASGILAATFGVMRAAGDGYDPDAVSKHRTFGFLVLGFTLSTIILQILSAARSPRGWLWAYRGSLLVTLALLSAAGHYGGNLTHGSNYLVANAPEFLRNLLAEKPKMASLPMAGDPREEFYRIKVQPIFANKCYSCHGPEKKKGDYRLDLAEVAYRGGDSEKTGIKPGDPLGSNLVRLILLPEDHDDVMPPSGKTRLTPEETGYVIEWIRNGAVFPGVTPPVELLQEG
ncbi:MAG: c-type cytochrome domain-containing protein [Verrucomicrobiales bacterium]